MRRDQGDGKLDRIIFGFKNDKLLRFVYMLIKPLNLMAAGHGVMYLPGLLEADIATNLFTYLRDHIAWGEGVRSRYGPTRKAKAMNVGEDKIFLR
jgi:hypothetical protein